jgi:hypothetical protein
VYVWVPAEDEASAREIVAAVESGAFALDEDSEVDDVPGEPAEDPSSPS